MAKYTFWRLARDSYTTIPPVPPTDLSGKTVVVIGANGGLGFEASKHLAKLNPGRLILGCRDSEKSRDALKAMRDVTGFNRIELWTIDLASFESVKAFADRVNRECERLDILLENASVTSAFTKQTGDGWESTLQVNSLSPALLAILLLPRMIETGKKFNTAPRLTIVSSGLHMLANLDQDLINSGHFLETYGTIEYCPIDRLRRERYNETKMLEIYFANALSARLGKDPTSPIVNTLDPGLCKSDLRRDFRQWSLGISIMVAILETLFAKTTEVGSRELVYAATGGKDKEDELRGAYLTCCEVVEAGDNVVSAEGQKAQEAYWNELISVLEKVDPRVKTIVREHLS